MAFINNLYKTWLRLNQHEAEHLWGFDIETQKRCQSVGNIEDWLAQPINQAVFQGYIQSCIKKQGWLLLLADTTSYSSIEVQVSDVRYKAGGLNQDTNLAQNLLHAYLIALAAQHSAILDQHGLLHSDLRPTPESHSRQAL